MKLLLGLVVLSVIVFSNTFQNSFHYDDFPQIVHNPAIKDITDLQSIWNTIHTRFIPYFSFALNYHLGGAQVWGYHALSLFIHLLTGLMVFWLALLLLKDRWVAFFASAIFLVHPIQTEPVNYIYQRAVLFAGFFYVTALALYVKACLLKAEGKKWGLAYAGAFLAALCGLLSKEMTASLPLAILCVEWLFFKGSLKRDWVRVLPFFALILLIPFLTIGTLKFWELPKAAETINESGVSAWQYFLTQLQVKITYLRLLFWPANQTIVYDQPILTSWTQWPVVLSALALSGLLWLAFRLRHLHAPIAFAIFWFFITLLPESSFIPINNLVCEYRLYVPMVGFSILVSYLFFRFTGQLAIRLLIILILIYSVFSYQRNAVWKDQLSLWGDAVSKAPKNQMAYLNRGVGYHQQGDLEKAMADYNMVIGLGPVTAVTLSNRGAIFREWGQYDLALANFDLALKIAPSYGPAYINRARCYFYMKEYDKVWQDLNQARKWKAIADPAFIEALKKVTGRNE